MDQVAKFITDMYRLWTADPPEDNPPPGHPSIHDREAQVIRLQTELALRDMAIAELEAEAAGLRRQLATRRASANPGGYATAAAGQIAALAQQAAGQRALLAQQADLLADQARQLATQRRHLRARDGIIHALLRILTGPPGSLAAPTQPFAENPVAAGASAPWGAIPAAGSTRSLQEELHLPGVLRGPVPLAWCALSTRTHNALMRNGISTINQVCQMTGAELAAGRWMGPRSVDELRVQLLWLWPQIYPSLFQQAPPHRDPGDTAPLPPLP